MTAPTSPAELHQVIEAATEAAEIMAPMVPNGLDPQDLVRGKLGAEALMPADGPRLPQIVREQLERRS